MAQPDILFSLGVEGDGQVENKLSGLAKKVAGYFAAVKIGQFAGNFIADSIKLAAEMETLTMQFEQFTGSAQAAEEALKWTRDFAAKTPFEFPELAQSQRMLLAFGRSVKDTQVDIKRLGDLSAGSGAPIKDLVYLYGTSLTQGRLYTRDIMQFAQRGIPIYDALAKVLGTTKDQVAGLVEKGKVGFPQLEAAIANMTEAGGKYSGLMDRLSNSAAGQFSTLKDNWNELKRTIGEGLLPVVKELVSVMNELLTDPAGLKEMRKSLDLKLWDRFFSGNREKFREFAKATGASNAELSRFIETLGDLQFNGQSTADVMLQLLNRWKAFKAPAADVNKTLSGDGGTVGLLAVLKERLKGLNEDLESATTIQKFNETAEAIEGLNIQIQNLMLNADHAKLADFVKSARGINDVLFWIEPPDANALRQTGAMYKQIQQWQTETIATTDAFAEAMKRLSDDLAGIAVNIASDFAEKLGSSFGLMITGADGVADAFRNLVNDLLVQIPKMVGMALINTAAMNIAAITSGASLPMLAAGLALVGLSGLISGIIQGREEPRGSVGSAADVAELPQRAMRRGLGGFNPERPEMAVVVNNYQTFDMDFDTNKFLKVVEIKKERKGI